MPGCPQAGGVVGDGLLLDGRGLAYDPGADGPKPHVIWHATYGDTTLSLVNASDRMPILQKHRWLLCARYRGELREMIGDYNNWPAADAAARQWSDYIAPRAAPWRRGSSIAPSSATSRFTDPGRRNTAMTGGAQEAQIRDDRGGFKYFHEQGVPDEQMKLMDDVVKVLGEDGVARLLCPH